MRVFLLLIVSAIFGTALMPAQEQPKVGNPLVLTDGEPVVLRITQFLSSENAQAGEEVQFEVIKPVRIGDLAVVADRAIATGKVVLAEKRRRRGRGGKLAIVIERVQLVTGEKASLRATETRKAGGTKPMAADMAAWMIYTSGLGAPLAPLFLLEHGEEMVIHAGTRFKAYFDGDVVLDRERVTEAQSRLAAAKADVGTVYIYRPASNKHAYDPPITCGELLIGSFPAGRVERLELPPGTYWFHAGPETGKVLQGTRLNELFPLSVEAGQTYYRELTVAYKPGWRSDWKVAFQPADPSVVENAAFEAELLVDINATKLSPEQQSALRTQVPPGRMPAPAAMPVKR